MLNRLRGTLMLWLRPRLPPEDPSGRFGVAGLFGLDEFESVELDEVDEAGDDEEGVAGQWPEREGGGGATPFPSSPILSM